MLQWLKRVQSNQVAKERLQRLMPSGRASVAGELPTAETLQIEINLLPAEYAPENLFSIRNISALVISFFILMFLAFDAMQLVERERALNLENQQMLMALNSYQQLKGEIDKLKERTSLLRERRDLIIGAIGERETWSDKLSHVYLQVPDAVWLSEITMKRERVKITPTAPPPKNKPKDAPPPEETAEQIQLHISGDTRDIAYIAEFIDRLNAVPFLENTRLNSMNQREQDKRTVMSFELIALMRRENQGLGLRD